METRFQNIAIAHDMTRKQREESKALVAEAKQKQQMSRGTGCTRSEDHQEGCR